MIRYELHEESRRCIVECNGDIAVMRFDPDDGWATLLLSDDYGKHEPGDPLSEEDRKRGVNLAKCNGVLIAIRDARSARTIEEVARAIAERLEAVTP